MTIGVGGSTSAQELALLTSVRDQVVEIDARERSDRIARAQQLMREQGVGALYLDASTSLRYFTGLRLRQSERLHGAVIPAEGEIVYVSPTFEREKLKAALLIDGEIRTWEEHENPTQLVMDTVRESSAGPIAIDEKAPFFVFDGLRQADPRAEFVNGSQITAPCRMIKSAKEIALIQIAMSITLEIHQAAARILRPGISTIEVAEFIAEAHTRKGVDGPLSFCIVLFGEPTAYPHGVSYPQTLVDGDMVLIDTGATVEGYQSDITRSYVFGEPSTKQREIWNLEKAAQAAAFEAAQLGVACGRVDDVARGVIEAAGLGPGYAVPGLPHRTGHGIGIDGHEFPYIVKGNQTPLAPGMCFSNEPMICFYGEFGVRLEDCMYMSEAGPRWFTQPSHSVDDPFGVGS